MGNASSQTDQERRQEEARKKFGVLIPPSFIVVDTSSDSDATLPISCQTRLKSLTAPNVLNDLWTMNQGRQLLETYMTPGATLSVPTATQGQILVALNTNEINDTSSFLWAEQPLSDNTRIELLVPTVDSPNFHMRYKKSVNENTFWSVRGQMNTQQKGWVESRVKSTYDNLDMLFSVSSSLPSLNDPATKNDVMDQVLKSIHLQAGAEYKDSLIAVQGVLDQNQLPTLTASMVSLNLNHQANDDGNSSLTSDVKARVPPLWLTLKQIKPPGEDTTKWTLNLSQILTFDRYVWNVLEERAPKVRQTLGWSLQMDTTTATGESTPETKWSVGTTWQVNRGLAFKSVMTTSNTSPLAINYGIIMKRWMQPRATLSILSQFEFATKKSSFLGFGLELEASPFTLNSAAPAYPNSPSPDFAKADEAAPTKVFVPSK